MDGPGLEVAMQNLRDDPRLAAANAELSARAGG